MVTAQSQRQIDEMAEFIALFNGPLLLQAWIAACAPRLDLELWQNMIIYKIRCQDLCSIYVFCFTFKHLAIVLALFLSLVNFYNTWLPWKYIGVHCNKEN